jgi:hypothetical protein
MKHATIEVLSSQHKERHMVSVEDTLDGRAYPAMTLSKFTYSLFCGNSWGSIVAPFLVYLL